MAAPGTARPRPLSPHATIYRMTITMAMSFAHRVTGVGLYIGVLLLAWFLLALAGDAASFATFSGFIGSLIGQLLLFGFTWALVQHMLGGLRHFMWDLGYGFEKHFTTRMAKASFIAAPVITILLWIVGYIVR